MLLLVDLAKQNEVCMWRISSRKSDKLVNEEEEEEEERTVIIGLQGQLRKMSYSGRRI